MFLLDPHGLEFLVTHFALEPFLGVMGRHVISQVLQLQYNYSLKHRLLS